jgi:hypothetical protein
VASQSKSSGRSKSPLRASGRGKRSSQSGTAAGRQEPEDRTSGNARTPRPQDTGGNQGEGNREADRRYREGVTQFERSGRVPRAADEARREIEDEDELGAAAGRDDGDEDELDFDANGGHASPLDFGPGARRSRSF